MDSVKDGDVQPKLFLQLWLDPIKRGALGILGAKNFHTLVALASFMDEKGKCFPSEFTLAKLLGLSDVSAISKRIKTLEKVIWEGKPVLEVIRGKKKKDNLGRYKWENNRYILNSDMVSIFSVWRNEQAENYSYRRPEVKVTARSVSKMEENQHNDKPLTNQIVLTKRPPDGGGEFNSGQGLDNLRQKLKELGLRK